MGLSARGHAAAILDRSSPSGWLFGCDRDAEAIEAAREHLAPYAGRFELRQGNFAQIAGWVEPAGWDGAVLDLGVSSPQLDRVERGFSFQADGPLDMRMDRTQTLTAADVIATKPVEELARIFWELGGEREARRLARIVDQERQRHPIRNTGHLAQLIEMAKPRRGDRLHPATKIFEALRIVVNDELGSLQQGLQALWTRLKAGGRLVVISFHSVEDRVVKHFGRARSRDYILPEGVDVDVPAMRQPHSPELRLVTKKPLKPGAEEVAANPRSRSAQLRTFEKLYGA
jgi:16S rRNA (cytosine1402-N4)-methyltransferase